MSDQLELFYAPQTRATGVRVLLEELGAPYKLNVLNLKLGENRRPDYLAINPVGKVPVLRHGEAVVTEQVAIYLYLADLFPGKGFAPALSDPLRGPYLRWFVYMASCFEPALIDRALKREEPPHSMSAYGSFDTVMENMRIQLSKGPFVLGERMTAVDILWGVGIRWGMMFVPMSELSAQSLPTRQLSKLGLKTWYRLTCSPESPLIWVSSVQVLVFVRPISIFRRRHASETGMRAVMIKVIAPRRDQRSGMAQAVEQMLVQALISHTAIEALLKAVLHRVSWCDVVPATLAIFLPFQDGFTGQFGSVVADHHTGIAPDHGNPVQLACYATT